MKGRRVGPAQDQDANRGVARDVRHHPLDSQINGHQTSGDRHTRQGGQRRDKIAARQGADCDGARGVADTIIARCERPAGLARRAGDPASQRPGLEQVERRFERAKQAYRDGILAARILTQSFRQEAQETHNRTRRSALLSGRRGCGLRILGLFRGRRRIGQTGGTGRSRHPKAPGNRAGVGRTYRAIGSVLLEPGVAV